MSETQQEEEPKFESGLTLRSAAAIIFASLAILPVSTYVWLVSGATLASAAVYITVILFSELSILMHRHLILRTFYIDGSASKETRSLHHLHNGLYCWWKLRLPQHDLSSILCELFYNVVFHRSFH